MRGRVVEAVKYVYNKSLWGLSCHKSHIFTSEQVHLAVTLWACIREVFGSNLSRDTG
jgi:hypothetical protein